MERSSLRGVNGHLLSKDLNKKCGPLAKEDHFTEGDNIVVKLISLQQQEKVKAIKEVAGIHIQEATPHHDLNTIKGRIYAPQLINKDIGWVTEAFEDRGAISISRLG